MGQSIPETFKNMFNEKRLDYKTLITKKKIIIGQK